ncbi:MAG: AAA family ATPase [Oenococcus sp.]|uniref:AAA family ATPase n=1 Tax=Oenococcus sp. TaxID=1979414 RepID=UPI0039EB3561
MNIEIYFETEKVFHKRVLKLSDSFNFFNFLNDLGLINNGLGQEQIEEKFLKSDCAGKRTCIFDISDTVTLNSFVFENIVFFVKMLAHLNIKHILVNNPPNLLFSVLRNMPNVTIHRVPSFKRIKVSRINQLKKDLANNIIGQNDAKQIIYRKLIIQSIRNSSKPLVVMFYGEPGVGKTEVAKQISKTLYRSSDVLREQMSMTGSNASIEYFKATGHNADSFSKKLLNRESNILLLDEFALAPDYIQTSFFQLFDEGKFVDQNYSVDMSNSIIICTSNFISRQEIYATINPALLSRFDALIHFKGFSEPEKIEVSERIISEYFKSKRIKQQYLEQLDIAEVTGFLKRNISKQSNFREIRTVTEDIIVDTLIRKGVFQEK